jgi:3-oxoacyl-[acyl-carrier protein] reductase
MDLKGKVALVTGGGTGLGRAIVCQLAKEGVNLAINYSISKNETEKTVREVQLLGVNATTIQADVASAISAEKLIMETEKNFGRLDILINNAGVTKLVPFWDLEGLDEADWLKILKTNTLSVFFVSRAAARIMKKNGGGSIMNTVSNAGLRPAGSSIAYSVSKAAGIHVTKCLAVALAPEIRVNAIAPGLLLTRWHAEKTPEQVEEIRNNAVLHKEVDIDECAKMYIAVLKNDNITGQIITIDSGTVI